MVMAPGGNLGRDSFPPANLPFSPGSAIAPVTGPFYIVGATPVITNPTGSNLIIQAGSAGVLYLGAVGGSQWLISGGGHFLPATDASFDVGSSSQRVRNVSAIALATGVKAGAAVDGDVTFPADGMIRIDSTNGRIYVRYGGAWHYAALT